MASSIHDVCLELVSRRSAPEEEEGILRYFAFLCYIARFALYIPPLCLRQRLPGLGQLAFPSKLLRRFLRGCVVFTAHGLVTPPASVFVSARKRKIWMKRTVARVMSGFAVVPLQAAAAARIAGKSGIIYSSVSGDVADVLSYLIADANSVSERDGRQSTALHFAACNGHPAVCELLIASKAGVDANNSDQWTALHLAACNGHTPVCELLFASKADVDAKNGYQCTALHYAARYGHPAMCELLIASKADVDAKDDGQRTALLDAASRGHMAVCELLIAGKADVDAKNSDGMTPLKLAIVENKPDVVALLRSVGASQ